MRYPTLEDVEDMRSRGSDRAVIESAEGLMRRAERVRALVREAFAGVSLGEGVGLLQGQAIDDYADAKTIAEARAKDEKFDWTGISSSDLNRCYSSLSFFDAEGMRFHLPAYLLADLAGDFSYDLPDVLTQSALVETQCSLLNPNQRLAVREYLILVAESEDYAFSRENILRALGGYWRSDAAA